MKKLSVLISFVCLLLTFSLVNVNAQEIDGSPLIEQTWVRVGGPLGGLGYDIRMDPRNPDVMYVTDAWAGVHKSVDGGKTWFPSNEGINMRQGPSGDALPVFCLTVDPNNPDTVWVGLQDLGGVYRSDDAGETWALKISGIKEREGLTIRGVSVEPGNSDVVYVAGEISSWTWNRSEFIGIEFDRVMGVVYRTRNGGEKWEEVWRGNNLARYVLIDPRNVNNIFLSTGLFDREAANSDPGTYNSGGEGILHSMDGGETWEQVNTGLENLYIGSLYMHPEDSQILLAGAANNAYREGGGVYITWDGGMNWEHVAGSHITSVEISETNPEIMYAAGDYQFFFSENGGKRWLPLHQEEGPDEGWGVSGIRAGFPIDMQLDPRDPSRIFVNNYGGGNFLSVDGGRSWLSSSEGYTGADIHGIAVDPRNPAVVYVNGRSGPFRSIDGGKTWTGINHWRLPEGALVVLDPGQPEHILVSEGSMPLLVKSFDMGNSLDVSADYVDAMWAGIEAGTTETFQGFMALGFAPSNHQRVYGGYGNLWCYREAESCRNDTTMFSFQVSDDGGNTWQNIEDPMINGKSIVSVAVHPEDENIVWAAAPKNGIYKSYDSGKTWEDVSSGLWNKLVMSLAVTQKNPEILYAGVNRGGVFKSEDGGLTWRQSSAGMDPNENVMAVMGDPQRENVVYAGSMSGGFYISQDSGRTWRQHNDGLLTRAIRVMAIAPDGNTVYVGTKGEGVFRLSTLAQDDFDEFSQEFVPTATPTAVPTPFPSTTKPPAKAVPTPIEVQESATSGDLPSKGFCPVSYVPFLAAVVVSVMSRKKEK